MEVVIDLVEGASRSRAIISRMCLILCLNVFLVLQGQAQRICATDEYNQMLLEQNPSNGETLDQFEYWMKQELDKRSLSIQNRSNTSYLLKAELVQIPVVVHVIHKGEPIGTGSNITFEQILSQIEALNEDFRRLNGDASETPSEFLSVVADIEVEFVLAKQDPEGLATTGIVRVQGSQNFWQFHEAAELKAESYWPAEDFLNIWVAPLSGGLLGFAQFPVSNLPGLEDSSDNRLTDGIVIAYQFFGNINKDPNATLEEPFNLGRTTTHEVGHFLGLRHIWGDGQCDFDDFVEDTPEQSSETIGCPVQKSTCSTTDMFQNYMDYTDDRCMNLFTQGQKDRIRVVLDSSPRRSSLLTSNGLLDPVFVANDIGIKEIITPKGGICESSIQPIITIRNYGSNDVTSTTIELYIGGQLFEQRTESVSLSYLDEYNMVFDELSVIAGGETDFQFLVVGVNGGADENNLNNEITETVNIPAFISLPYTESFEPIPSGWQLRNDDGLFTWDNVQSPSWETANECMRLNYYDDDKIGEEDMLVTPLFDLSLASEAYLIFDRAYSHIPGLNNDRLQIAVSTDCGENFDLLIYDRAGSDLNTTSRVESDFFIPSGRRDWVRESISLNFFVGQPDLQLGFRGVNGNGNNLYIDNIMVTTDEFFDAGIKEISTPSIASCLDQMIPMVQIENTGLEVFNQVEIRYSLNGGPAISKFVTGPVISTGQTMDIELDEIVTQQGENLLTVEVVLDNDSDEQNNSYNATFTRNCISEEIPLRESFNNFGDPQSAWLTANIDGDAITWFPAPGIDAVYIPNFEAGVTGLRDYLVSPLLDLTNASAASIFFEYSYAYDASIGAGESFNVLASSDGGATFDEVIYSKSPGALAVSTIQLGWVPTSDADWTQGFINLNDFAGGELILAFEITGRSSNNFYLRDIEFFVSDDPNPLRFEKSVRLYPNPATAGQFNLNFNLSEKEDVIVQIINSTGGLDFTQTFSNILNQTVPFDLAGRGQGIYFIKITGQSFEEIHRIFIQP